jgi:hypothetical protein
MPRPRRQPHPSPELDTIWTIPDALRAYLAPILAELDPPKRTGRPRIDARQVLEALIVRIVQAANGTTCLNAFPTIARSTEPFSGGWRWAYSPVCGRSWWTPAPNWGRCIGNGRLPTEPWAKPGLGGQDRPEPHRTGQTRREAQCARGGEQWSAGNRDRRGQHSRYQALGGDDRGNGRGAAPADSRAPAASLPPASTRRTTVRRATRRWERMAMCPTCAASVRRWSTRQRGEAFPRMAVGSGTPAIAGGTTLTASSRRLKRSSLTWKERFHADDGPAFRPTHNSCDSA